MAKRYALRVFGGPVLILPRLPVTNATFYARSGDNAVYTHEGNEVKMSIIVPIDDYSPILQGDTGNPFSIQVLRKNGFMSIVGAVITMKMQNVNDLTTIKTCNGAWTIDPSDNGKASYAYQASDVSDAGNWYMWVKITVGGKPVHIDDGKGNPKILVIEPLPVGV
jgi:hypothetical protein